MEILSRRLPWTPLSITPVGDIQFAGDERNVALDTLKRTIDRGLKENSLFIGMGDYLDTFSPSNRQRLSSANLYDTALDAIDDMALSLTKDLYEKILKPTKGRWLGMLEGHHFTQLKSGMTSDQKLCELLGARFLGTTAYIRLVFGSKKDKSGSPFLIWASHGCGSSMKSSAQLNKLDSIMPYFDADLFLMAHQTKQVVGTVNRISPQFHPRGGAKLIHRKIMLVGTGGFSKAYVEGSKQGRVPRGGYVEQGLLAPAALGAPIIRIVPKRTRENGKASPYEWTPEVSVEI